MDVSAKRISELAMLASLMDKMPDSKAQFLLGVIEGLNVSEMLREKSA